MPIIIAVHWLVVPDVIVAGEQDDVTDVIVGGNGLTMTVADPDLVGS